MISLRAVPLSGDKLTDWIFKQFIFFLQKETLSIKRKKRLMDPYKSNVHRKALRGLMDPEVGPSQHHIEITLNCAKSIHCNRDEEVETLIHELCHILFWKTRESFILQMEKILVLRLTIEQKNFLKLFLPRHEVKN